MFSPIPVFHGPFFRAEIAFEIGDRSFQNRTFVSERTLNPTFQKNRVIPGRNRKRLDNLPRSGTIKPSRSYRSGRPVNYHYR